MFGMKIWSTFAAFRDPLTITQNITLPIPPKTTIGGMMAAILGIGYEDYFNDSEYFNFSYSLVLITPIRKKSFAQNYIEDYTKSSETKFNIMEKFSKSIFDLNKLVSEKTVLALKHEKTKAEEKKYAGIGTKITNAEKDLEKSYSAYIKQQNEKMTKPKPIFRELLLSPEYVVFIKDFKYETEMLKSLKNHFSAFLFYMGNTEFAANYRYIECKAEQQQIRTLDSFTAHPDHIVFEPGRKYTKVYAATKTVSDRQYRDYKSLVVCNKQIRLNREVAGYLIKTEEREFNCEFI
ncbi:MAG TPA: CRISPR-associated protein Cas5 [Ignavibacteria bacterium]|nr:CRISPR-associated protein Cas5 [Ignavibacteria bacterium]